jgi:hypothetical protein
MAWFSFSWGEPVGAAGGNQPALVEWTDGPPLPAGACLNKVGSSKFRKPESYASKPTKRDFVDYQISSTATAGAFMIPRETIRYACGECHLVFDLCLAPVEEWVETPDYDLGDIAPSNCPFCCSSELSMLHDRAVTRG